jgi:hypothetical protein
VRRRLGLSFSLWVLIGLLALPSTAAAVPRQQTGGVIILPDFQTLKQGRAGLVRVMGQDLAEVRAVFQERLFFFYQDGSDFVGLLSADMESDTGTYTMQVWVKYADGTAERIDQPIEVVSGEFGRSDLTVPNSLVPLLQPEVEQAEHDKLFNILTRFTPDRYWVGGFTPPNLNELVAWFGTWRLYNSTYWSRHTGVDIRAAVGTSVTASAAGRVMLSEELPIRGGYVMIDHGWGVYTGYAHLSSRLVVPGQWVKAGEVIGLSGLSGRTTGAHLHWEIAVSGVWVDPEDFVTLGLNITPQ